MLNIAETVLQFPRLLKSNVIRSPEEENILGAIQMAEAVQVTGSGGCWEALRQRKYKVLVELASKLFIAKMSKRYALLNDAIFRMPRFMEVAYTGIAPHIVPRIIKDQRVPFTVERSKVPGEKHIYIQGKLFAVANIHFRDGGISDVIGEAATRQNRIAINASMPGEFNDGLMGKYTNAISTYHTVMAEMYKIPKVADILSLQDSNHNWGSLPKMSVIWIPPTEALSVNVCKIPPRTDPAMILRCRNASFLVHHWDVEGEEPFEHIIREFSLGEIGN